MGTVLLEHNITPKFLETVSAFHLKISSIEEALSMPFQIAETPEQLGRC